MRIYLLSRMLAALVATPASILSLEKLAEILGGSCFLLYSFQEGSTIKITTASAAVYVAAVLIKLRFSL